jgi:hypothetical protein
MLGSSWVAAQLAASQEGLSSVSKHLCATSDRRVATPVRTSFGIASKWGASYQQTVEGTFHPPCNKKSTVISDLTAADLKLTPLPPTSSADLWSSINYPMSLFPINSKPKGHAWYMRGQFLKNKKPLRPVSTEIIRMQVPAEIRQQYAVQIGQHNINSPRLCLLVVSCFHQPFKQCAYCMREGGGAGKSLASWKKEQATGLKKCIYSPYPPWAPHTYNFVVLTSLTYPRKIMLFVLQIGKWKSQRFISTPTYLPPASIY